MTEAPGIAVGRQRYPALVVVLVALTFGLYFVAWIHATVREIRAHTQLATVMSPGAAALLACVPLVNLWVVWRLCRWVREMEDQHGQASTNAGLVFVLFLVPLFWPAGIYAVQSALNAHWRHHRLNPEDR